MQLQGKVVVVTGGGSGLGAATAAHFAAGGARVAILDRDSDGLERVAAELGGKVLSISCDVTDGPAMEEAFETTVSELGAVHVCVNCAGIPNKFEPIVGDDGPMPLADFTHVVDVNLTGTFNTSRLAAAAMMRNSPDEDGERGLIVLLTSVAGIEGQALQVPYSASKAGVIGLLLPMMRDLSPFGIRVMAVAPGVFDTPMVSGVLTSQEARDYVIDGLEFPKRQGRPEEFARLVGHIAENAYLNGEVIRIDAGTRARPR